MARMRFDERERDDGQGAAGERCGSSPGMAGWQWGLDPDPTNLDVVFDVKTEATALSAKDPLARDQRHFAIKRTRQVLCITCFAHNPVRSRSQRGFCLLR